MSEEYINLFNKCQRLKSDITIKHIRTNQYNILVKPESVRLKLSNRLFLSSVHAQCMLSVLLFRLGTGFQGEGKKKKWVKGHSCFQTMPTGSPENTYTTLEGNDKHIEPVFR